MLRGGSKQQWVNGGGGEGRRFASLFRAWLMKKGGEGRRSGSRSRTGNKWPRPRRPAPAAAPAPRRAPMAARPPLPRRRATRPVFVCLSERRSRPASSPHTPPRPYFPSLFNHQPLALITQNELQLIQAESYIEKERASVGKEDGREEGDGNGRKKAAEGGVRAGEGMINKAPSLQ